MTDILPHVIEASRLIRANPESHEAVAEQIIAAAEQRGRLAERERCAGIAETVHSDYAPDKVTPEIAQMAARKMYAGIRAPAFDTDGWDELDHARKELLTASMTAAILAAFAVLRGDQIERIDNAGIM
jgi:hypothetical protein